jgi:hypothetical protein
VVAASKDRPQCLLLNWCGICINVFSTLPERTERQKVPLESLGLWTKKEGECFRIFCSQWWQSCPVGFKRIHRSFHCLVKWQLATCDSAVQSAVHDPQASPSNLMTSTTWDWQKSEELKGIHHFPNLLLCHRPGFLTWLLEVDYPLCSTLTGAQLPAPLRRLMSLLCHLPVFPYLLTLNLPQSLPWWFLTVVWCFLSP